MSRELTTLPSAEWADPGFFAQQSRGRNAVRLLKQLVFPPEGHKTLPTATGAVLLLLMLGIGSAAYNTSSNILFMTLSLLISSLLLSGILSWLNFKGTRWRLLLEPHFRAGEVTPIRIELSNSKELLPTYSLWFNVRATVSAEAKRVYLHERLDPKSSTRLSWMFEPKLRGVEQVEVSGLETQFPFGFLRKIIGGGIVREVVVWPARVEYEFKPVSGRAANQPGSTNVKPGGGSELVNLRNYQSGDPQRLVHWKASARLRRLMVRQMCEENQEAYLLFVETPASLWSDSEQFETLCSFVASLAEDLFMEDRLWGAAINDDPVLVVKKASDLHYFLERLAKLKPVDHYTPIEEITAATVVNFGPGPGKQVYSYVGGNKAGSA
jgi:uncharacterized protein (DUF58 family)